MFIKKLTWAKLQFKLISPQKYIVPSTLLVFAVFTTNLYGQGEATNKKTYQWFDTMVGQTNSGMFKGVVYENEYRVINERHQFFESEDFEMGSVSYYGQRYFDIPLKYDVYLDNLLVVNDKLSNRPIMQFDKNGVSEFEIDGYFFKHISIDDSKDEVIPGFYQVLLERDSLVLYKKLKKKIFKRTDEQMVYYEFKDFFSYLILKDDTYYSFEKAGNLSRFFPKLKKQIKIDSKTYTALKKTNYDDYIIAILSSIFQFHTSDEEKDL